MISNFYDLVKARLDENKQEIDDFLQGKIKQIERDLDSGRVDAEVAINQLKGLLSYRLKDFHYTEIKNKIA